MPGLIKVFYLALGSFLLLVSIVDLLWTAFWVDGGAGPLSSRLTTWIWHGFRRGCSEGSRVFSLAGPTIVIVNLLAWIGLVLFGWVFLFAGGDTALIDTRGPPATSVTWEGRIWYVGYTMFTVGNGDFYPPQGIWQLASTLVAGSGFAVATVAISYLLAIVAAVSEKRAFASSITGLGEESETIVREGWNGEDLKGLDKSLDQFASNLSLLADQHKAFPILHYYHPEHRNTASSLAVAIFDESLMLIQYGVPEEYHPTTAEVKRARASTGDYLQTLETVAIEPTQDLPPPPALDGLREEGIPTVSDEEFEAALDELEDRRRTLKGLVEADGWKWSATEP